MSTTKRCQFCSECSTPELRFNSSGSLVSQRLVASNNGWTVTTIKGFTVFFCSSQCEQKYRVKTKTHLKTVK